MQCLAVTVIALQHRPQLTGDFRRQYALSWGDVCALEAVEFTHLVVGLDEGRFSEAIQTSTPTMAAAPSATVQESADAYLRRVRKLRGHVTKTRAGS